MQFEKQEPMERSQVSRFISKLEGVIEREVLKSIGYHFNLFLKLAQKKSDPYRVAFFCANYLLLSNYFKVYFVFYVSMKVQFSNVFAYRLNLRFERNLLSIHSKSFFS